MRWVDQLVFLAPLMPMVLGSCATLNSLNPSPFSSPHLVVLEFNEFRYQAASCYLAGHTRLSHADHLQSYKKVDYLCMSIPKERRPKDGHQNQWRRRKQTDSGDPSHCPHHGCVFVRTTDSASGDACRTCRIQQSEAVTRGHLPFLGSLRGDAVRMPG